MFIVNPGDSVVLRSLECLESSRVSSVMRDGNCYPGRPQLTKISRVPGVVHRTHKNPECHGYFDLFVVSDVLQGVNDLTKDQTY